MWLITNERHTDAFGIEKIACVPLLSVHGAISSASLLPARAARVPATRPSKVLNISARLVMAGLTGLPATSNSDSVIVIAPQRGSVARCVASWPSDIDFACGFQS